MNTPGTRHHLWRVTIATDCVSVESFFCNAFDELRSSTPVHEHSKFSGYQPVTRVPFMPGSDIGTETGITACFQAERLFAEYCFLNQRSNADLLRQAIARLAKQHKTTLQECNNHK